MGTKRIQDDLLKLLGMTDRHITHLVIDATPDIVTVKADEIILGEIPEEIENTYTIVLKTQRTSIHNRIINKKENNEN